VGAGNSAGQAALFFSTHARSVTILCRSDRLEKSMSRYLIDQLARQPNIRTLLATEIAAVHGDQSLEAIDVRELATGATSRLESGGLFIFIGADAETGWLPAEIAVDQRAFVLTGTEMRATGRWALERDSLSPRDERPGRLRVRRRAPGPGQARGRRGRRRQHGDRLRAPVPQGGSRRGATRP
jgi:thioredoxin reductase (NADPH)